MSYETIHKKMWSYILNRLPTVFTTQHISLNSFTTVCLLLYVYRKHIVHIPAGRKKSLTWNQSLTFLWLTHFSSTSSLYARLACVWFWKGRHSFFTATGIPRTVSSAELSTQRQRLSRKKINTSHRARCCLTHHQTRKMAAQSNKQVIKSLKMNQYKEHDFSLKRCLTHNMEMSD